MDITVEKYQLIEEVSTGLQSSGVAYKEYLHNGKTYGYAIRLKEINSKLRILLLEKKEILGTELQDDANKLIAHYEAWTKKWNDLEHQLQPLPADEFIFPNEHRFPREAAHHIEQEWLRQKELRK